MTKLLEVNNLTTCFQTRNGMVTAVDDISLHINKGEILGVVGESGCGKSITALSVMNLLPRPHGRIVHGSILFQGEDLLQKSDADMRKIRGKSMSMIFQEPMTSLNPYYTCGEQIAEVLQLHLKFTKKQAFKRAAELLQLVGISSPAQRVYEYPHQLSGGMRQRVMIAMALSCNPQLLIADEPTTALDVTIQAQILALIKKLRKEFDMAVMLITHDLGVIAEMAERVIVMYAGKVVEQAAMAPLLRNPFHPYTKGLLKSIPLINGKQERLETIKGVVPGLQNLPQGCRFHPRCAYANDLCQRQQPILEEVVSGRWLACWLDETR